MRLRRRVWLPLAIVGVLALGAGMVFGVLVLLRGSAPGNEDPSFLSGLLPGSEEREIAELSEPSPAPETSEPNTTPTPNSSAEPFVNPSHGQGDNLAVLVRYKRGPTFDLSIDTVARTSEPPTIQHYEPPFGAPFSLLRLLGENGSLIAEYQFAMPISGIGEGFDAPPEINIVLEETTAYLIVDVPSNTTVSQVQLVTLDGRIFDEQSFLLQTRAGDLLQRFLSFFGSRASAQPSSQFTIVVINDRGVNGVNGMAQTVRGITQIEPWATFADRLNVVPIQNRVDLNCVTTSGGYPVCEDGRVRQAIGTINPNVIIVLTSQACNCGFAPRGSNIAIVGSNASSLLVAHELGHTVGKMADEYLYLHGNTAAFAAPNCFNSLASCQSALAPFAGRPGGVCSPGCSTVSNFRPATRLMHNIPGPHGPLEECIMGRAIARAIGATYDCPELATTPSPPVPGEPGDFWGWFR